MKRPDYAPTVPPDSLRVYLKEIAAFPQLTPEEEKAVCRRVREGDPDAFRRLVESNLRFVVSLARKYARSGYPIHELINEGNLGLIEAARRFDPDRDVRFVTYAGWWVRQAILAAIAHYGQAFSIPPKVKHELYRFETRVSRLAQELGRRPTVDEISEQFQMRREEVQGLLEVTPKEAPLNADLGPEGDFHLADVLEDASITPADDILIARSFERQLRGLLDQLDDKERLVVERRFGLDDDEPRTLAEIGAEIGLSRERVRQIEARALDKLRRSQRARQLMGYLN